MSMISALQDASQGEHAELVKELQKNVEHKLEAENIKWRQRVKQHWLKMGDRNTKFFHMQATQRRKTNAIKSIRDLEGNEVSNQQQIGETFTKYFSSLFTTSNPSQFDNCLSGLYTKVSPIMNEYLLAKFTEEHVKQAAFQMNPLGSPGPYGFPTHFYQSHWETMGNDITRLISDNLLVAYEALHFMNSRMKGKIGFMTLKLDMSKAYDEVEWSFLEAIMLKLGFSQRWCSMVLDCITSISYSILVNGKAQAGFSPSRGLRKGDPLSPCLFILCVEALSSLLFKAKQHGDITCIPIGKGPIRINHMFFVDDNLLFCKANVVEWCKIS
ncbi:uncharacterized protein LOC122282292 [Carya illinoinensis]|uniref:uncharacterized protein LOC122282292 n=1 Tax=Carya illinoinensis TaxID=32201 RepID=UPI001C72092C|nr:uncharacterized protein LOC122282292 [Carya illinoinensis]